MQSRTCKGSDFGYWSGAVFFLFGILNLATGALEVIDRNLDQQYSPGELDLLPVIINNSHSNGLPATLRTPRADTYATVGKNINRTALLFVDKYRQRKVAPDTLRIAQDMLASSPELTLLTKFKQNPDDTGPLIALDVDTARLEMASQSNQSGIFFSYRNSRTNDKVSCYPFKLSNNGWHNLAVTIKTAVTGNEVVIRLDCQDVWKFRLTTDMLTLLKTGNLSLWFGQGSQNDPRTRIFKSTLDGTKVTTRSDAYLTQCRDVIPVLPVIHQALETAYPETSIMTKQQIQHEFELLRDEFNRKMTVKTIEIRELQQRVTYLEQKSTGCNGYNGTYHDLREVWIEDCQQCTCNPGGLLCHQMDCPLNCSSATKEQNECCPSCKKDACFFMGTQYQDGDTWPFRRSGECLECLCTNGRQTCVENKPTSCPVLSCPESLQILELNSCCRKCREKNIKCGNQTCDLGGSCHSEHTANATCKCDSGFAGNGTYCQDVDECQLPGLPCGAHTVCTNTIGGHRCDCMAGFNGSRLYNRRLACRDINECQDKSARCHANATCSNTEGSYGCQCLPGFDGDGFDCTPRCEPECQNGGRCFAPNKCYCKGGYVGPECNTWTSAARLVSESSRNTPFRSTLVAVAFAIVFVIMYQ